MEALSEFRLNSNVDRQCYSSVRILASSDAYRHAFEKWGFRFAPINHAQAGLAEEMAGDEHLQVLVEAIPNVVSKKV